mmetsp:Transcript_23085/g.48670  ORF Transcript_23085/g.48670 Transcript_23085/m.48670 type:complete len:212 (-) Transcript_23085:1744-2379(-)
MVSITPLLLLLFLCQACAFAPISGSLFAVGRGIGGSPASSSVVGIVTVTTSSSSLFSSPTPTGDRPPPRRTLKKRKNKRRRKMDELSKNIRGMSTDSSVIHGGKKAWDLVENDIESDVEIRPVRRRDAVEAGLDYWIDESELERERQRKVALKNRKSMEGVISKKKLREEVVAPYKQNWIGLFSVVIVVLSAIGTNFPELLQVPVIPIPDL